jgi:hypothetical protein
MPEKFNTNPSQQTFPLSSSDEKLKSFQGGRNVLRQHRQLDAFCCHFFEVLVKAVKPSRWPAASRIDFLPVTSKIIKQFWTECGWHVPPLRTAS